MYAAPVGGRQCLVRAAVSSEPVCLHPITVTGRVLISPAPGPGQLIIQL